MDEIEEAFRDGLRDAVSSGPAMAPIQVDEVLARAELASAGRRPVARWVGLAAAVTLAAGLGLWALQTTRWTPTDARETGTPGTAAQVRTLRVHNDTASDYHQAALQLADGRRLPLGDVPAGGTVMVPLDGSATLAPVPSTTDAAAPGGWRVLYSGDCGTPGGQLFAVVETGSEDDGVSIQVVAAPAPSAVAGSVPDGTGPTPGDRPRTAASGASLPACTVTITQDLPTPEPTHS